MKKSELIEIKKVDIYDISARIKKARIELQSLILDKSVNKLKDTKSISRKRQEIAQLMTIIKQKELLKELEVQDGK